MHSQYDKILNFCQIPVHCVDGMVLFTLESLVRIKNIKYKGILTKYEAIIGGHFGPLKQTEQCFESATVFALFGKSNRDKTYYD